MFNTIFSRKDCLQKDRNRRIESCIFTKLRLKHAEKPFLAVVYLFFKLINSLTTLNITAKNEFQSFFSRKSLATLQKLTAVEPAFFHLHKKRLPVFRQSLKVRHCKIITHSVRREAINNVNCYRNSLLTFHNYLLNKSRRIEDIKPVTIAGF